MKVALFTYLIATFGLSLQKQASKCMCNGSRDLLSVYYFKCSVPGKIPRLKKSLYLDLVNSLNILVPDYSLLRLYIKHNLSFQHMNDERFYQIFNTMLKDGKDITKIFKFFYGLEVKKAWFVALNLFYKGRQDIAIKIMKNSIGNREIISNAVTSIEKLSFFESAHLLDGLLFDNEKVLCAKKNFTLSIRSNFQLIAVNTNETTKFFYVRFPTDFGSRDELEAECSNQLRVWYFSTPLIEESRLKSQRYPSYFCLLLDLANGKIHAMLSSYIQVFYKLIIQALAIAPGLSQWIAEISRDIVGPNSIIYEKNLKLLNLLEWLLVQRQDLPDEGVKSSLFYETLKEMVLSLDKNPKGLLG